MRILAIIMRFAVVMCIMIVGMMLMMLYTKIGNPDFYIIWAVSCYSIVAFFALQGIFRITQELVDNAECEDEL